MTVTTVTLTIYLCIISHNRPHILKRCVDSLQPISHRVQIWTLQQGLPCDYKPIDFNAHERCIIAGNLGCAGGRKYLLKQLPLKEGDITVWLDDDIVASGDVWLDALIQPILNGQADITGVEGMEVLPTFYTQPTPTDSPDRPPHYVSGGWCAISAKVFLAGVTFDVRFTPNYWEDVDLCVQARGKGFRIAKVDNCGLFHQAHPGNPQAFEYSRAQFMHKYTMKK